VKTRAAPRTVQPVALRPVATRARPRQEWAALTNQADSEEPEERAATAAKLPVAKVQADNPAAAR
jgi:hypothetical protein